MKIQFKIFLFTFFLVGAIGAFSYYHQSDDLSSKTTGEIKIRGDETCLAQTKDALHFLKTRAGAYYKKVERYISIIECVERGSAINVYERPTRFRAGKQTREAGVDWYAGSIVHDACHIELYETYARAHPWQSPPRHIWSGETAEQACVEVQIATLKEAGTDQETLKYLEGVIESKYWENFRYW